jgi:hypothetical protein
MPSVAASSFWKDAAIVVAICLAGNVAVGAAIAWHNPGYLSDFRTNNNPDAIHYVVLGRNVWTLGEYSRLEEPPYVPDILRPPLYPLLAGSVQLVAGQIWPLYALHAIFQALTALAVLWFGRKVLDRRVGLIAGVLVAADAVLWVANFEAMSESLYVMLATWGTVMWLSVLRPQPARPVGESVGELQARAASPLPHAPPPEAAEQIEKKRADGGGLADQLIHQPGEPVGVLAILTGSLLGLATLTRPAGVYLPIALLMATLIVAAVKRSWPLARWPLIALAIYSSLVIPWIVRNYAVFGIPRMTITDSLTKVYFSGAGAIAEDEGLTREEAQAKIAEDYNLETVVVAHNYWRSERSVAEMDTAQRAAYRQIVAAHPRGLAISSLKGFAKAMLGHDVNVLAHATGLEWRGARNLRSNPPLLSFLFIYQETFTLLVLLAAIVGYFLMLRNDRWLWLGVSAALGYYALTVLIVGLDAYTRHRLGMTPLLAMLAAVVLSRVSRRLARPK